MPKYPSSKPLRPTAGLGFTNAKECWGEVLS